MANYNVTITNGTGSESMKAGLYNVTATANGYDVSTLDPKTFNATSAEQTENFTLTANGTLTFNVNETGAEGGTPVTSGTIVMTDQSGNTTYGEAVNINATGDAVFNNVPYGTGITLYFKQLTTDDNHNIDDSIITVTMTDQNQTAYIQNTPIALQSFTLNDATYGLPIDGELVFTESN